MSGRAGEASLAWLEAGAGPVRIIAEIWATIDLERANGIAGPGQDAPPSDADAQDDAPPGDGDAQDDADAHGGAGRHVDAAASPRGAEPWPAEAGVRPGTSGVRAGTGAVGAAAVSDELLGARVLVLAAGEGRTVALAEPTTEGRLAATLARRGEGPVGRYVAAPTDLAGLRARAASAGISLSRARTGPFGPSVLVLGGPIGGPLLVLVAAPAVPSRP